MTSTTSFVFDHSMISNKTLAKTFLRELGINRDWARITVPEMKQLLRGYADEKLMAAAKRITERDGEVFDLSDWEIDAADALSSEEDSHDDQGDDQIDDDFKPVPVPQTAPLTAEPVSWAPLVRTPPAPAAPKVTPVAGDAASELAAAIAKMMAGQQTSVNPSEVAAIANTVFDSKALTLADTMRESLQRIVDEAIKGVAPREIVVRTETSEVKIDGLQHFKFEKLLKACAAKTSEGRLNVWMFGPPGTGKTTAARNVAKALGLSFYTTGAILTKYDITGFIAAQGNLIRSDFREAWERGGIFLLDEIDGSDPRAIVAFNAALANGVMAFPDGMVERHPDCVMIAAANTAGMGATAEFNSRTKLDMASADRFIMLSWPNDETIEEARCPNKKWYAIVKKVRANIESKGIKGMCVTPRACIYGCALLDTGMDMNDVKDMVLRKGMSAEQWAMIDAN